MGDPKSFSLISLLSGLSIVGRAQGKRSARR
jgi:hypothetical protein